MITCGKIVFINREGIQHFFHVWVVLNSKDMENGLRGVSDLRKDHGMVFENPSLGHMQMNMRGMKIPLDIIFVSVEQRVTGIIENAQPNDSYIQVYKSTIPSRYVVEVPAGTSKKLNIQPGTIFKFA